MEKITMTSMHYTPLGPVSTEFKYIKELMERAAIGYRDEEVTILNKETKKEEKQINRSWFIVQDEEKVPTTRKKSTGKTFKDESMMVSAGNRHRQFCMIRDAVAYLCKQQANDEDVLAATLQKIDEVTTTDNKIVQVGKRVDELWKLPWKQCENAVVAMGVHGYTERAESGVQF